MTDRPDPRRVDYAAEAREAMAAAQRGGTAMSDLVTDAMVEAAAKEIYEQWASRDNETRMFAPMWDSLRSSSKSGWLQDARIALEAAAPAIAAKALRDAANEYNPGVIDRSYLERYLQNLAYRIERGES